jgi:hypothetical protein
MIQIVLDQFRDVNEPPRHPIFWFRRYDGRNLLISDEMSRCRCIKWPDIESHKILSVASRFRRVMIMFDKLFLRQWESNSLYSILQINDTKSARNGRWVPWSSAIWLSRFQSATAKNAITTFPDTMIFSVHSGNDIWHSAPDYERYSYSLAPLWSTRYYIKWFSAGINIFDIQLLTQNEKCPVQSWMWVVTERSSRREPLWSLRGLTIKPTTACITQTVVATITISTVLRESPGNGRTNSRNAILMSSGVYLTTKTA